MDFRVLGPVEVCGPEGPLRLGGLKRRELLALFLTRPNQPIAPDRLADELWNGQPPDTAASALRVHITHLRSVLEPDRARSVPSRRLTADDSGYTLHVEPGELDAERFESLLRQAAEHADPIVRLEQLEQALAEFRDAPFADVNHLAAVIPLATHLDELRMRAFEAATDIRLARGDHTALVAPLAAAVNDHPLRERLTAQLMVALYRSDRQAEALAAYRALRTRLAEELGIDPAPELRRLERSVLLQEEDISWTPDDPTVRPAGVEPDGDGSSAARAARPPGAREPGSHERLSPGSPRVGTRSGRTAAARRIRPTISSNAALVGRGRELARLEDELERAASSRARPVIVRGEAGIGKSRLVGELVERNASRANILTVSCSEHLVVPYLPVVRLLEQLATLCDADAGARLDDVAHRLSGLPEMEPGDGNAPAPGGRARLFMDVVRAVDDGLVETLWDELFARARGLRVLLVLTERTFAETSDPAVGRRLERRAHAISLFLRPFGEIEVDELIRHQGIDRPSRGLVSTLFDLSRGNPLYVGESLRRIEELDGFVERDGTIETTVSSAELGPPADLTDLVGRRLEDLPEAVVETLTAAAVAGDRVDRGLLEQLLPGTDVVAALAAATTAGFLVETTEGPRFAHPLTCRVLADRPALEERRRLHSRVAEALLAAPPEEHGARAAEIAHHLVESGLTQADEATMSFLWLAGRQTYAIGAWADSARFFDAAGAVGRQIDADPAWVVWCAFAAGRAHDQHYDYPSAFERYAAVIEYARSNDDVELWGRAVLAEARLRDLIRASGNPLVSSDSSALSEVLEVVGEDRPRLRSRLLALCCTIDMGAGRSTEGIAKGEAAVQLAHAADDGVAVANAESVLGMASMSIGAASDARRRLERALDALEGSSRPDVEGSALARLALTLMMLGQLETAATAIDAARDAFSSVGDRKGECLSECVATALASLRGDFAAAEFHGELAESRLRFSRDWFAPLVLYPALCDARSLQGDDRGADAALGAWKASGQGIRSPARALVAARAGLLDADRVDRGAEELLAYASFPSMFATGIIGAIAEVAATLDRTSLADALLAPLEDRRDPRVLFSPGWGACAARTRGVLLALTGRHDAAVSSLRQAITVAEASGALPELGRAHLDLGTLLGRAPGRGASAEANEHLTSAALLFEQLGLPRLLDAAETTIDATPERRFGSSARNRKVLLLTDIVESTRVSVEAGDDVYLQLVDDHDAIVRRRLDRHGGIEAHSTGDGILAWFRSPDSAIACALDIRADVRARNESTGRARLELRIGLALGRPIERDGDLYGAAVNLTARLCSAAPPGEAVVDAGLRQVSAGPVVFDPLGPLALKGFAEPVVAFIVRSSADSAPTRR